MTHIKNRDIWILPSLLSADFSNLKKDTDAAAEAGAEALHCDIMDGHFVPNITFGPMVVNAVKRVSDLPLFVHLMIENADRYVEAFANAGAYEISVHVEACVHLHRTIQTIKSLGVKAGVALNPATSISTIENVIGDIDTILIMTVNPGFGGQSFIESTLPKIERARRMVLDSGREIDIAVDGGVDVNTAPRVASAGANLLIAGSSVYSGKLPVTDAVAAIRASAEAAVAIGK